MVTGLVLTLVNAYFGWTWQAGLVSNAIALVLGNAIETVFLVIMAFVCAYLVQVAFGPTLWTGTFKLTAMAFCVGSIADVIGGVVPTVGWLFAWGFAILAYLGLLMYLFDQDASESAITVMLLLTAKYVLSCIVPMVLVGLVMSSGDTGAGIAGKAVAGGIGAAASVTVPQNQSPVIVEPDLPAVRADDTTPLADRKGFDFTKDVLTEKTTGTGSRTIFAPDGIELFDQFDVVLVKTADLTDEALDELVAVNHRDGFAYSGLSVAQGMAAWDNHAKHARLGGHSVIAIEMRDQPWTVVLRRDTQSDLNTRRIFYYYFSRSFPNIELVVLGYNDNQDAVGENAWFFIRLVGGTFVGQTLRFDASSIEGEPFSEDPGLLSEWKAFLPEYRQAIEADEQASEPVQVLVDARAKAQRDLRVFFSRFVSSRGRMSRALTRSGVPKRPDTGTTSRP